MPPTETHDGMLCLSRHDNCPWDEALKSAELTWTGLRYSCLKILHLYCKVFEREDVLEMVISLIIPRDLVLNGIVLTHGQKCGVELYKWHVENGEFLTLNFNFICNIL